MKLKFRVFGILCAACILLSSSVYAAEAEPLSANAEEVHADVWRQTVQVENVRVSFFNEQGVECDPLAYQGTIYIPLRTAGEWMGADAVWDQDTMTATLTTGGEPYFRDMYGPGGQTPVEDPEEYDSILEHAVTAPLSPDITVVVDGEAQRFVNAGGAPVYPVSYNGSIYLPARSIGDLCGKEVLWFPWPDRSQSFLDCVYFYDSLTGAKITSGQNYLNRCDELLAELTDQKNEIKAAQDWDEAEFSAALDKLRATAEELAGLAWPNISFLQTGCNGTTGLCRELIDQHIDLYGNPDHSWPGVDPEPWQSWRDTFISSIEGDTLRLLENRIAENHRLLDAAVENQTNAL